MALHQARANQIRKKIESADPNLRRIGEVVGYKMQGRDGELGVVDDFIVEDGSWIIRYLVLDTQDWLSGKRVLIAPPINREYEVTLYDYYGRPYYWN
jgi:hypothetical protein